MDQYTIRPATETDMDQVLQIFAFYIQNTTISFMLNIPPLEYIIQRYRSTTSRKLPYLVATSHNNKTILGFCHASPFSSDKGGYASAVDFSLFVTPESVGKGVGGALLGSLIAHLTERPYLTWEQSDVNAEEVYAKNLYAVSSADLVSRGGWEAKGETNWEWYRRKFGFREVGRLPGIGRKFEQR